jgi:hypothetical protein
LEPVEEPGLATAVEEAPPVPWLLAVPDPIEDDDVEEDDVEEDDVKEDDVEEEEPGSAPALVGMELLVIPSIASSSSGITITVEGAHQACLSWGYISEKLCSVRTASTSFALITK